MSESGSDSEGVSMLDVLNEENRLEQQARLVLGDTDDANCTYPLGYVKRQPLYACLTCNPPHTPSEPGGVCLACSLHCHQGHDLVEMYTKRNFRCDCGNSRFPEKKCKLVPEKAATNVKNVYSHNFRGLYCVCDRPYPDPDRNEEGEEEDMLQCAVCEDWFHVSHLDVDVPSEEASNELVCARCVEEHQFLEHYEESPVDHGSKEADEEEEDGICRIEIRKGKVSAEEHQFLKHHRVTPVDHGSKEAEEEGVRRVKRSQGKQQFLKRHNEQTPVAPDEQHGRETDGSKGTVSGGSRSVFLPDGWRTSLCRCDKCLTMYRREGVDYLLDPEDTMRWYEERGERGGVTSRYNMAMERLAGLDRVVSAEAVEEYNRMQENLKEYLKKFAGNGKMVREEDIKEFFEGLAKRKRRRLE